MKLGILQQHNTADIANNKTRLAEGIIDLAHRGAELIVLQELHNSLYFCQVEDVELFNLAEPIPGPSTEFYGKLAKDLGGVIVTSLFERRAPGLYHNTAVVIEKDGSIAGKYRKMHIPDDPAYYEKFYFTPGDLGFRPIQTSVGKLGVLVCWDQWYPEAARLMALQGAELLFYPTAIGSEPLLGMDSSGHWQRCMQGHAAANLMPVIAANRIGTETVEPCAANQNQQSELTFYGTSFITDQTGAVLKQAGRTEDTVLLHTFDLDAIQKDRLEWGLFRDRRPEQYGAISSPIPVQI